MPCGSFARRRLANEQAQSAVQGVRTPWFPCSSLSSARLVATRAAERPSPVIRHDGLLSVTSSEGSGANGDRRGPHRAAKALCFCAARPARGRPARWVQPFMACSASDWPHPPWTLTRTWPCLFRALRGGATPAAQGRSRRRCMRLKLEDESGSWRRQRQRLCNGDRTKASFLRCNLLSATEDQGNKRGHPRPSSTNSSNRWRRCPRQTARHLPRRSVSSQWACSGPSRALIGSPRGAASARRGSAAVDFAKTTRVALASCRR